MLALRQSLSLPTSKNTASAGFANLYSLAFDGVDDYVTMGDSDVLTPNDSGANRGFSISLWVKVPSNGQRILSKSNEFSGGSYHYEYDIKTDFAGRAKLTLYSSDSTSNNITFRIDTALSFDTWHNVVFSWDLGITNTDLIGYVDGVRYSVADGNATWAIAGTFTTVTNTDNPLILAKLAAAYGQIFLDEVAIFDNITSDADATSIYNSGTPDNLNSKPFLLGWWRNGDTAGTSVYPTITDDSSNSNDGTMTNMDSGDIVTDVP